MHTQFFIAWVIIAVIWLWGTMLVAIFYPLIDGGIQQMRQVYRGLTTSRRSSSEHVIPSQEDTHKDSPSSSIQSNIQ